MFHCVFFSNFFRTVKIIESMKTAQQAKKKAAQKLARMTHIYLKNRGLSL